MREFPETALVDPSFLQAAPLPAPVPVRAKSSWLAHVDLLILGGVLVALLLLGVWWVQGLGDPSGGSSANTPGRIGNLQLSLWVTLGLAGVSGVALLIRALGRLAAAASQVEGLAWAQSDVLTHVREGLMLLTPTLRIAAKPSAALSQILGHPVQVGDHVMDVLKPLLGVKDLAAAKGHLELLVAPNLKAALMVGINPLSRVKVQSTRGAGSAEERHLSFLFHRIARPGLRDHLLVSVQDVSELVALQSRQADERRRGSREFAMLLKAFDAEPGALREFVERAETSLMEINGWLRSASGTRGEAAMLKAADLSTRNLQALKLHSDALGLDGLSAQMQRLDVELQRLHQLQGSSSLLEDALPRLQSSLDDLLSKINPLKGLAELRRGGAAEGAAAPASLNTEFAQLAQVLAYDGGKRVNTHVRVGAISDMPPTQHDLVRDILTQLLRNAVVHGIETPSERQTSGKSAEGRIDMTLDRNGNEWTLSVRDNGAGVATSRIRHRLLALGWYSEAQLEAFTERQLMGQMFKPGFSAGERASEVGSSVGGLELVVANAQKLAGQFRLNSSKGEFTEFQIRFQA